MNHIEQLGIAISKFVNENNLVWTDELRSAWEKAEKEARSFESILDQAFKDQTDAERYMHLKHILIDQTISTKFHGASHDDIDACLDELIRSYDE